MNIFHEAAHATFALLGGDKSAYHGGQVTLNPLPHIRREPFGTVVFPLASVALIAVGIRDHRRYLCLQAELRRLFATREVWE